MNMVLLKQIIRKMIYAFFPSGIIALWSGAEASIPSGWALCDGTNGTPNLQDRFIVGAGSTYAVGATGGADSITLLEINMPSHTHIQDAHNHTVDFKSETNTTTGGGARRITDIEGATGGTGTDFEGTIDNRTAVNQNTGGGTAHENRPPYYALCYIMKL